ncbi:MAG: hypothetical protein IT328_27845 [Caldilineaceae bacterium]|nr:hypothetical protein [Caldilineaceae bacterium]
MAQCTAKNRRGEQCRHAAINGTSKCRFHGGASLAGIASPSFKTGRYSKHLPTRLAARYGEALSDPQLLELRDEIALIGTRQSELLGHLDSGLSLQRWQDAQAAHAAMVAAIRSKDSAAMQVAITDLGAALDAGAGDYAVWREVVELTEQRRKLVESEHKRLVAMQQMITTEQAMTLLAVITDTVRKHVTDPSILAGISADFRAITLHASGE